MKHEDFMTIAAAESERNLKTGDGGPFGAIIIKNGKIVGTGHNEVLKNGDPTCHAEMQAIRNACQNLKTHDLTDCIIYTSCYPCPMCLSALIWANIKTVYYGNTARDAANIGFRDDFIYHFIEGKCQDESVMTLNQAGHEITIKAFDAFANQENKTMY